TPAAQLRWQQDPHGNRVARISFGKDARVETLELLVELALEIRPINPFDFLLDKAAEAVPFTYPPELQQALAPYLSRGGPDLAEGSRFQQLDGALPSRGPTLQLLTTLNQEVSRRVRYVLRDEPGVWTPEQTLTQGRGSCRDSAVLTMALLRARGLATRFGSGYLRPLAGGRMLPRATSAEAGRGRPARLGGGLPPRRRMGRSGRHQRSPLRRGTHPAGLLRHPGAGGSAGRDVGLRGQRGHLRRAPGSTRARASAHRTISGRRLRRAARLRRPGRRIAPRRGPVPYQRGRAHLQLPGACRRGGMQRGGARALEVDAGTPPLRRAPPQDAAWRRAPRRTGQALPRGEPPALVARAGGPRRWAAGLDWRHQIRLPLRRHGGGAEGDGERRTAARPVRGSSAYLRGPLALPRERGGVASGGRRARGRSRRSRGTP